MTARTSAVIRGSRALVGSSKRMARGSIARVRAMATRCCWPPESSQGRASDLLAQADPVEEVDGAALGLVAVEAADVDRPLGDVLQHRTVREEVERLEDHADAGPDGAEDGLAVPVGRVVIEAEVVDDDRPVLEPFQAVEAAEEGALAAARGADDHGDLAPRRPGRSIPAEHVQLAPCHFTRPD